MKHFFCALFLYVISSTFSSAQKLSVSGFIRDAFTKEKLLSVKTSFLRPDSTVALVSMGPGENDWNYFQILADSVPPGKYILRFEKEGYFDAYATASFVYVKHRKTSQELPVVYMRKKPKKRSLTENELGEAVVTATKIKMVMKGDTVVYNADAFNLASGSMLDKLIDMLPGVKLEHDGQMFVNGEKVQSLLVNGDDFFKGDPKVALDNLPAYMVDKVKAYHKMHDINIALGTESRIKDKQSLPLVLDVQLKREYSVGWLANMTAGYGTDNHYLARFFALRFTPRSRLTFVGNYNDCLTNGSYDSEGNFNTWGVNNNTDSQETYIDYLLKSEDKTTYKLSNQLWYKHLSNETITQTSSTTFFAAGDMFTRILNDDLTRWHQLRDVMKFTYNPKRGTFFEANPVFRYYRYNNAALSRTADFSHHLSERYVGEALDSLFAPNASGIYRENLLSSLQTNKKNKGYDISATLDAKGSVKVQPDVVNFNFGGSYNHCVSRATDHSVSATGSNRTDRFSDSDARSYKYYAGASYDFYYSCGQNADLFITPFYNYEGTHHSAGCDYFEMTGQEAADWDIDKLSSTKDALTQWADAQNTYNSQAWKRTNSTGLSLSLNAAPSPRFDQGNISLEARLPLRVAYDKLEYERGSLDTLASRRKYFFEPELGISIDNNNYQTCQTDKSFEHHFRLNYQLTSSSPSLLQTIDYRDSTTPLIVRLGNRNLKDGRKHHVNSSYSRSYNKRQIYWNAQLGYTLWHNAIVQAMSYDNSTGVRTYRPDVINGNWQIDGRLGYDRPLDMKQKHFRLRTSTTFNYRNSADLLNLSTETASLRNSVRRTVIGEDVRLVWGNQKGISAEMNGTTNWSHSTSNRYNTLNAVDFSYGANFGIWRKCGFEARTDISMHSRRGYSDKSYNTDQLIWNASVSQSVLNGNLLFKLETFDILNKMSSYSYSVNAQMQTESYTNVLRRYLLLNVTYRLNREHKKQK